MTPSPWIAHPQSHRPYHWEVHTPTIGGPGMETIFRAEIARVIREDDARLIAAAPDLLAACQQVADTLAHMLQADGSWTDCPAAHKRGLLVVCQGTIAKVTGMVGPITVAEAVRQR